MFCFVTDHMSYQMNNHPQVERKVENLKERLEISSSPEEAEACFQASTQYLRPYLRHGSGDKYRIIGRIREWEAQPIAILNRVLIKDGTGVEDHGRFDDLYHEDEKEALQEMQRFLDQCKDRLRSEFDEWIQGQSVQEHPLPDSYRTWLKPPSWKLPSTGGSLTIYETPVWKSEIAESDDWGFYSEVLGLILVHLDDNASPEEVSDFTKVGSTGVTFIHEEKGRYILFSHARLTYEGGAENDKRGILLIKGFDSKPDSERVDRVVRQQKLEELLLRVDEKDGRTSASNFTASAVRAYPEDIAWDHDTWKTIVKSEENTNLALSPEESEVLESIAQRSASPGLPLFVNGRAGSGKSTMLLYLFADYCDRRLNSEDLTGDPLFITYSERLLEHARTTVLSRLNSNAHYLGQRNQEEGAEYDSSDIDNFFSSFQALLRRQLPQDQRKHFEPERRVTFALFKEAYENDCNLPDAKKVSSGLAWHVIRSFIKGHETDDVAPGEYAELPESDKQSVAQRQYESIYEHVYQWYCKYLQKNNLWDDQDLVRQVLELNSFETVPVVFCDEAQDFTRLELDFIRRLSTFSHYDFELRPTEYLPFAFAGDPLQTLNPTGFRWDPLKATFHEQLLQNLPSDSARKRSIRMEELKYNYRSQAPIVHVCNLILAWRKHLFGATLEPQMSWFAQSSDDANPPRRFITDGSIEAAKIRRFLEEGRTIIVPCEEGKEREYIDNDPFLKESIELDETSGDPPRDVMTAVEAKGLDLDQVVVYGFGDYAVNENLVDGLFHPPSEESDERVEHSYFLNRLYVALSRARTDLIVIDSPTGNQKLWKELDDIDYIAGETGFPVRPEHAELDIESKRRPFISDLPIGDENELMAISDPDHARDGENFFRSAMDERDPRRMLRAKRKYMAAGMSQKSKRAEAYSRLFRAEKEQRSDLYQEAATDFEEISRYREALNALWEAGDWPGYVRLAESQGMTEEDPGRFQISRFLDQPQDRFGTFIEAILEGRVSRSGDHLIEAAVSLSELAEEKASDDSCDEDLIRDSARALMELGDCVSGITDESRFVESAATLLYQIEAPGEALDLLVKRGVVDREIYHRSRAADQGFPNGLQHLTRIENKPSKHILEAWDREVLAASSVEEAVRNLKDPETWAEFAGPPLNRSQRYPEAFWLYREARHVDHMLDNLEQAADRDGLGDSASHLFAKAAETLIDEKEWTAISSLLESATRKLSDSGYQRVRNVTMRRIAFTPKQTRIRQDLQEKFASLARRWIEVENPNPAVAGIALERIGRYKPTTEFYDMYVDANDPDLRSFARMRHIATMEQWADFYLEEEKLSAAISLENKLDRQVEDWGMDSTTTKVSYNEIHMGQDSVQRIIDDRSETGDKVSEPDSSEVEAPNLDVTLRLKHDEKERRVRIYFGSKDNGASIDFDRQDIAPQGWVELNKRSDEDRVEFSLSPENKEGTHVEGTITKGENPCARLNIKGLDHPLEISL